MRAPRQRGMEVPIAVTVLVTALLGTSLGAAIAEAQARAPSERAAPRRGGRGRSGTPDATPHSDAERARALLGQADFEGALAAADAAEAGASLDREGLIALLETRVLIEAGLGRQPDVDRDLARLAALAPGRAAPPSFPPPIAQRLTRAQEGAVALGVDARVTTSDDGAVVTGTAGTDAAGLVRGVRVAARVDEGAWQTSETGTITVPVAPGETLEYYAAAIGPGGAVIATAGTEAEPRTRTRAAAQAVVARPTPVTPTAPSDDTPLFIGLGVGGGVLVLGAVIVVGVVAGGSNDATLVTLPMER